jgi:copper chaperone CopZ
MSFLVSTPTTGIDSIFVTYAFLGATFAIVRPISALIGGILVGTLVSLLVKEKNEIADIQPASAQSFSLGGRLAEGLKYGFGVLPEDVGKTVLVGVLLGGAIAAFLPQDFSQEYLSNPLIAYPLMLVISVPLYVCAIGSVPIAAAMMTKGLMPGAALAFLIAGTATNVVTIAFVAKKFGKNMVLIYLVSIMLLALASGIVLDFLMGGVVVRDMLFKGRELPYWLQLGSLIFFVGLVSRTLFKGKGGKMPEARYTFHVPNMECKHCQAKVEQAVKELPGVTSVQVMLGDNLVRVDGEVDEKSLKEKIEKAGYTVAEKE